MLPGPCPPAARCPPCRGSTRCHQHVPFKEHPPTDRTPQPHLICFRAAVSCWPVAWAVCRCDSLRASSVWNTYSLTRVSISSMFSSMELRAAVPCQEKQGRGLVWLLLPACICLRPMGAGRGPEMALRHDIKACALPAARVAGRARRWRPTLLMRCV